MVLPFSFCLVSIPPDKPMRGKQTVVRPGATWGHFGAVPPKSLLVPPPNENCAPPSEDCAPKKLTGSVRLESNSRPKTPKNTGYHSRIRGQELFFWRFCIKDRLFLWLHPKIHENSRTLWNENLFFLVFTYFLR